MKREYPPFAAAMLSLLLFDALLLGGMGLAPVTIILAAVPLAIVDFLVVLTFPKNYRLAKKATPQGRPWSMLSRLCLNHNLFFLVSGLFLFVTKFFVDFQENQKIEGVMSLLLMVGIYVGVSFARFLAGTGVATLLALYGLSKTSDKGDRKRLLVSAAIGLLSVVVCLVSNPDFFSDLLRDEQGGVLLWSTVAFLSLFFSWGIVCFFTAVFGKLDAQVSEKKP